jgi:ferrous iron transport protein B
MNLLKLNDGESAEIIKIGGRGAFRRRVMEMGLMIGEKITAIRKAPLNDPVEYKVKGSKIILRNADAALIEVSLDFSSKKEDNAVETQIIDSGRKSKVDSVKDISIAFIGNCTSGKTTIFNYYTNLNERVGNYAGVTVETKKHKVKYKGYTITFIDLPGVYSLSGKQKQKTVVRDYLFETLPDVIINVVDATSIERSLYLTTELIDSDLKVVMALNMFDDFVKNGFQLDVPSLGYLTGIPVLPVTASRNKDLDTLLELALEVYEDKDRDQRHIHINYGEQLEKSIKNIQSLIKKEDNTWLTNLVSSRFLAIKLLEKDHHSEHIIEKCFNKQDIEKAVKQERETCESLYKTPCEQLISNYKFGFINGALKETMTLPKESVSSTDMIDSILTHKVFGLPIFFLFMWLMFTATFKLGSFPMQWIAEMLAFFSGLVSENMADGMLKDLLTDGILSGVGGVLVFLPNILILYFFISLMEDTGYMSRAVFIMDKIMHRIGLHGKSFIPLVMGFGCNVPAILATRILENKKERLITILINPFISCNARLPVYILFITAFFPNNSGTILFFIYLTGILLAVLTALLLNRLIEKKREYPFVMELPPYRTPSLKVTLKMMWNRSAQYLKKIGTVILIAAVIFWALSYFPLNMNYSRNYEAEKVQIIDNYNEKMLSLSVEDSSKKMQLEEKKQKELENITLAQKSEHKELSYLGRVGHFIEPVIRPLGFDWRIGITILSGIPAKEIIVSSLAVLYHVDSETDTGNQTLVKRLQSQTYHFGDKAGQKVFNPAVALAFMIFVLLYIPCIGTITAISREAKNWRWGLFSVLYSFSLAWLLAFAINQIGNLFL